MVNLADQIWRILPAKPRSGAIKVMALTVRLALVNASDLANGEVKLRTFPGVHKLRAYDGVIRLARTHLGR
jgi:hypothetical protein